MARVTSSRDRSRGRANRPVTSSRGRANRQGVSTARVSNSNSRPSSGTARVTRNQDARRPPSAAGRRESTRPTSPSSTGRSLPASGGTRGNTPRAQAEAGWARDRGAKAQVARAGRTLQTLARGAARIAGVDRASQAQNRLNQAARGTRGEGTRVVPPGGGNPGSRPSLPAARNAGTLPPGQRGGALANRPTGGPLATRGSSALATRGSSALANRPSSTPVDGRLVGVNVAEVRRRPRLEGQRALPSGQRDLPRGGRGGAVTDTRIERVNVREIPNTQGRPAVPPANWGQPLNLGGGRSAAASGSSAGGRGSAGRSGGALATRPTGGAMTRNPSGALATRPSSGGGRPGANRPALQPGRPGSPSSTRAAADQFLNRPPNRPLANSSAIRPQGAAAGRSAAGTASPAARPSGGGLRMGGVGTTAAGAFLTPFVQAAGNAAGQWIGRNLLLPIVDRYEDKTPGTQSARERRRQIERQGGRQGPPVPERLRRATAPGPNETGRPSRNSGSSNSQPAPAAARPQRAQAPAAARPQATGSTRPQAQSSGPVSAPAGMNGDPLQGRTGRFNVEGSPLTVEPAPMPGTRPQAPVTASTPRPSAAENGQRPTFTGPGAPQPMPENAPGASQRPTGQASGSSPAESTQKPTAGASSGQSERSAASSRLSIPSRGPTGREEMIQYNIQRARKKRKEN